MNREELKKDIYYELRERFSFSKRPYEEVQSFALNEFFADYVIGKITLKKSLEELKPVRWKCMRCGRDKFAEKTPHNCDTGYRKRNIIWRPIFN